MSEYIRALIFILLLASLGFAFCKKLTYPAISNIDFKRWRNIWFLVVTSAFLSSNFWLFIALASFLILIITKQEKNRMALFFILVFALPSFEKSIPGFGLVNNLFSLSYIRFISLVILVPAALITSKINRFTFFSIWTDKFIIVYIVLITTLELRGTTTTDALRSLLYTVLEVFLPYYVASRSIINLRQMNNVLYAFVISAIVVSFISGFESVKHWLLYNNLPSALDANFDLGGYLGRSGGIRAIASLGHPIVLGCFISVSIGFYLYLNTSIENKNLKRIAAAILVIGLLAPMSRGPWISALLLIILFILQGPMAFKNLSKLLIGGLIVISLLATTPMGQKIINLLPIVGKVEKNNIDYREQLLTNSLIVIARNPIFGSVDYLKEPEMLELIQGQGIIDVVNTYIGITLSVGYAGLVLFISIFASVILAIRRSMKLITDKRNQLHLLGRSLVAVLLSSMFMISTTSSIASLPIIYWSILGLGIAYTRIVKLAVSTL